MAKRKAPHTSPKSEKTKKSKVKAATQLQPLNPNPEVASAFREGLFKQDVYEGYAKEYRNSEPYTHAVVSQLVEDQLLRNVRKEIMENISFTPKETDIYRIHQSGDLANLSGLDSEALKRLPSLLKLRDAIYSSDFRAWVSRVTGCGDLSGKKTDMAVNVYTQGCHLLNHDDVIGSRRISYILYLTDPDEPWKPEWGGALRLYPTEPSQANEDMRTPLPFWSKVIPPAWNQLSFFEVQPGLSFHDVEEVLVEGKVRMAISGWFHIPQEGEDGYVEGLEEKLAEKSSLQQLVSKSDVYDQPAPELGFYEESDDESVDEMDQDKEPEYEGKGKARAPDPPTPAAEDEEPAFTAEDLDFLLKYISPNYLIPDTLSALADELLENSSIQVGKILHPKFAARVKKYILARDGKETEPLPSDATIEEGWHVATPPHKHRYLYMQPSTVPEEPKEENPIAELITELLPSRAWKKFLELCTKTQLLDYDVLARRFRRGLDYELARGWDPAAGMDDSENSESSDEEDEEGDNEEESGSDDEKEDEKEKASEEDSDGESDEDEEAMHMAMAKRLGEQFGVTDLAGLLQTKLRVEVCLGLTPTKGWHEDETADSDDEGEANGKTNGESSKKAPEPSKPLQEGGVGGYEMYMFAEDPDDDDEEDIPPQPSSSSAPPPPTGKKSRKPKSQELDPAVYQSSADADDAVAFVMPARWNYMSIVLRDRGILRFVKYVSQKAPGDRWDVVGAWGAVARDGEDEDEEEEEEEEKKGKKEEKK